MQKTALVTGASRGIGFEVCRQLGILGYKVIAASPGIEGKIAARKLCSFGVDALYHNLDVADDRSILSLFRFVSLKLGRLDVLINNAGVMFDGGRSRAEGIIRFWLKYKRQNLDFGQGKGVLEVSPEIIRATLEINTLGALRMCQVFVPLMIKQGYGRIVNVSSSLGQLNDMDNEDKVPAYQISKTALNAVTRLVASATLNKGIKVNSVCPGWTKTELGGKNAPQSTVDAADTIIWLVSLAAPGPTGGFFRNRRRIAW